MTPDSKQEKISGRTYVKDESIIYESDQAILAQIAIKDIRIIGEYTTSDGPLQDDWFFTFIMNLDDIRTISAFAIGADEMLTKVGLRINAKLTGHLANSSNWKSNVLWPTSLSGQELFELKERQPTGTWDKIKSKLGAPRFDMELTENLKRFLS